MINQGCGQSLPVYDLGWMQTTQALSIFVSHQAPGLQGGGVYRLERMQRVR